MTVRFVAMSGGRLDRAVVDGVDGISRARVAQLIRDGRVRVEGAVVLRPSAAVAEGQAVEVEVPAPTPLEAPAQDLPLRVVYEDGDIVVIDKDPGMVVHPGAGHADGTLVNALLHHVRDLSGIGGVERPGIVHRLDRGTSGLLVVAKHDAAHQHLAAQFAAHTARRRYLAVTLALPEAASGTIRSLLGRHAQDRVRFASVTDGRGKPAVTHWRVLGAGRGLALLGCELETGRTHQIRVHLSEQGWPLLGDPLYRLRRLDTPAWLDDLVAGERPMLHAWQLTLEHPRHGDRRVYVAPPPDDLRAVLARAEIAWDETRPWSGEVTGRAGGAGAGPMPRTDRRPPRT